MFICDATFLPFARMIYRWKNWILNIVYERHRIKLIIFIWCAWDRFRNDGLQYQFQCCDAFDLPTVMYDKWEHCCFSPPRESNCRRGKVLYTHTHTVCVSKMFYERVLYAQIHMICSRVICLIYANASRFCVRKLSYFIRENWFRVFFSSTLVLPFSVSVSIPYSHWFSFLNVYVGQQTAVWITCMMEDIFSKRATHS